MPRAWPTPRLPRLGLPAAAPVAPVATQGPSPFGPPPPSASPQPQAPIHGPSPFGPPPLPPAFHAPSHAPLYPPPAHYPMYALPAHHAAPQPAPHVIVLQLPATCSHYAEVATAAAPPTSVGPDPVQPAGPTFAAPPTPAVTTMPFPDNDRDPAPLAVPTDQLPPEVSERLGSEWALLFPIEASVAATTRQTQEHRP